MILNPKIVTWDHMMQKERFDAAGTRLHSYYCVNAVHQHLDSKLKPICPQN